MNRTAGPTNKLKKAAVKDMGTEINVEEFRDVFERARSGLHRVIVGNDAAIEELLICFFVGGHALLEGAPGIGKTLLVKTLGNLFDLHFSRIQFTPDLMPSDIIGTNFIVETPEGRQFRFHKGPLFAQIVLTDEINRATPKTQSALLEAMQERSVTLGDSQYAMEKPFLVLATQNPIEMEGTYPLPEAQLDRFLFKIYVGFPNVEQMAQIISRAAERVQTPTSPICDAETLERLQHLIEGVQIASGVKNYIARLVLATHPGALPELESVQKYVRYGASPRAALAIALGAKARALIDGRLNVSFEDVKALALPALRHRLILNFEGDVAGKSTDHIVREIIEQVPADDNISAEVLRGTSRNVLARSGQTRR
jgi:MoxR-like ATPase